MMTMKTRNLTRILMAVLVVATLNCCASTGSDSGPHYVPHPNGKGGVVLAPQWWP